MLIINMLQNNISILNKLTFRKLIDFKRELNLK